ncbi:MAG TPA: cupin domain-containing protein, partial [Enteractinococcus sp.]
PGYSVFPHYHTTYTEILKVLDGAGLGHVGGQKLHLKPGEEIVVAPRVVHGWEPITSGHFKGLLELRPAHKGFEKWIVMLHNMAADGLTKPDLQPNSMVHGALFLVASGTHLAGPARVLNPVFKLVAWWARKAGVDRRLEKKYYHTRAADAAAT